MDYGQGLRCWPSSESRRRFTLTTPPLQPSPLNMDTGRDEPCALTPQAASCQPPPYNPLPSTWIQDVMYPVP
jgi:hypothetical protein